jgi:nucleoporin POM152
LGESEEPPIQLPVNVKGVAPWTLVLQHRDVHGTTKTLNFTLGGKEGTISPSSTSTGDSLGGDKIPKALKNSYQKRSFELPVTQYGTYRVSKILDSSNDPGTVLEGSALLVPCPSSSILHTTKPLKSTQKEPHPVCLNEETQFEIQAQGVPPLRLWLGKKIGHKGPESIISLNMSPLKEGGDSSKESSHSVISIERTFTTRVNEAQSHAFRVLRVVDGLGNAVDYDTSIDSSSTLKNLDAVSELSTHKIIQTTSHTLVGKTTSHTLVGKQLPQASFLSCDNLQLRMDQSGKGVLAPVNLPLSLSGNGNWTLELSRSGEDDSTFTQFIQGSTVGHVQQQNYYLPITSPGMYRLKSVKDAYCSGSIHNPSVCQVSVLYPPTVQVMATPIETSCIGAVGTSANLSFTGSPPFWIEVLEENTGTARQRKQIYEIPKSQYRMQFRPEQSGTYQYSFLRVRSFCKGI